MKFSAWFYFSFILTNQKTTRFWSVGGPKTIRFLVKSVLKTIRFFFFYG